MTTPDSLTLQQCQQLTDEWITSIGVRYYTELTNVAVLMEEVGEMARLFARAYGDQSFKKGAEPADLKLALADEMADVLFVLVCLANQTGIDLTDAFRRTLEKKTQRDRERHAANPKLQS
jgi:NTP pyrophosphatase (non-canonical NTP hydrolase)